MGSCSKRFGVAVLCVALLGPAAAGVAEAQSSRGLDRGFGSGPARADYERGYDTGVRLGEQDASRGRGFDPEHRPFFNKRDDFRRGFTEGYRAGFVRFSSQQSRRLGHPPRDGAGRRPPHGFSEPAAARGFSDGYEDGVNDGRRGDRYDPVSSRDYRDGDTGYFGGYGSRDAYRTNYRAGFRQGYEEGYRDGARARR